MTVLSGLPPDPSQLQTVLKKLKAQLGTGGAVKDGTVEIQVCVPSQKIAIALSLIVKWLCCSTTMSLHYSLPVPAFEAIMMIRELSQSAKALLRSLQGDHASKIVDALTKMGFKARGA